jgi:hypothetical protein
VPLSSAVNAVVQHLARDADSDATPEQAPPDGAGEDPPDRPHEHDDHEDQEGTVGD